MKKLIILSLLLSLVGNVFADEAKDKAVDSKINEEIVPVEIDEELLKSIAAETGGSYYRATDNKKLAAIYKEIDKLERTDIEEIRYTKYHEKFRWFVFAAMGALFLEWLLRLTLFKSALA